MAIFTKKEYNDLKNQYILGCASGDFPHLAKVESLYSLGGTFAKSDFDLDMLKVDIKTKHFKKFMVIKKARALLSELKSKEPATKSDYAKDMLVHLQDYVCRCEVQSKRKTIVGCVCGALCAVLLGCTVGGFIWMDKSGLLYGATSISFTADGQEYIQNNVVKYNNYVQLSSMPTKKGYDATGIVDTKTNTVLFDATGKSLSVVSNKDLSDYIDCDLEVMYEPHVYSAQVMTANNVSLGSVEYTVEDDPEDIFDEPQHLDGYVFDGWFTDAKYKKPFTGDFMDYTDISQPLVLYPHYSLDGWSITWQLNGGAFKADVPDAYTILSDVRLPDGDMVVREGYKLMGWSIDGKIIDYFTPTIMQDTTLSAEWNAIRYKITYELNGGVLGSSYTEFTIEDEFELETPIKPGYIFAGWYANKTFSKSATAIEVGTIGDKTLYAKWSPVTYSISYNLNGGENSLLNPVTYTADKDVILQNPQRVGYTFAGWLCCSEKVAKLNAVENGNAELSALWQAKEYVINVIPNNGNDAYTKTVRYDETYSIELPERKGYDFNGYTCEGDSFNRQGIYKLTKDITISAKYTPIAYTITYELNGGENSLLNPVTYTADKDVILQNPQRVGYTFAGWLCGGEKVAKLNAVETGNAELSALWQANQYTISVIPNNGKDAYAKTVHYDESYSIELPERKGYDFNGYTFEGELFNRQGVYQLTKDITISADYTPIVYTIAYELNGGENSFLNPITYTADKDVVLQTPQRVGYTFKGWFLNNQQVIELEATAHESVILTASWEANEFTITINPNNGSDIYKKSIRYNEYYSLEQPVKKGYTFIGFSSSGEPIDGMGQYTFATDIFLIAGFKANQYTISYVSDSTTESIQQVTYGEPYALYNPKAKLNYEFVGWFDKSVGGSRVSDGVYQTDGNIVLYASWQKVITYNIESDNDYIIDSSIDKAYLIGNYTGNENLLSNVNVKIATRYCDLRIELLNVGFKASNDNSAIYAESDGFLLTVEAIGNCYICGGDGNVSTSSTVKSNDGKAAIEAARLVLVSEQSTSFKLQGGNGADGCRGTDGAKENTGLVWCNWGWDGGDGGQAGNSGAAICVITYTNYSNVELLQGVAGTGGAGGAAGYRAGWFAKTWGSDGSKGKDGEVVSTIQYKSEWN